MQYAPYGRTEISIIVTVISLLSAYVNVHVIKMAHLFSGQRWALPDAFLQCASDALHQSTDEWLHLSGKSLQTHEQVEPKPCVWFCFLADMLILNYSSEACSFHYSASLFFFFFLKHKTLIKTLEWKTLKIEWRGFGCTTCWWEIPICIDWGFFLFNLCTIKCCKTVFEPFEITRVLTLHTQNLCSTRKM